MDLTLRLGCPLIRASRLMRLVDMNHDPATSSVSLETKPAQRKTATKRDYSWRDENVGILLVNAGLHFERHVLKFAQENGRPDVKSVHIALFRSMDLTGTRLTDLASRAGMSKQAMQEIVDLSAKMGLVVRKQVPEDKRAKMIVFTSEGLKVLDLFGRAVRSAEASLLDHMGAQSMNHLRRALNAYLGFLSKG